MSKQQSIMTIALAASSAVEKTVLDGGLYLPPQVKNRIFSLIFTELVKNNPGRDKL